MVKKKKQKKRLKKKIKVYDPVLLTLKLEDYKFINAVYYEAKNSKLLCERSSSDSLDFKVIPNSEHSIRQNFSTLVVKIKDMTIFITRLFKADFLVIGGIHSIHHSVRTEDINIPITKYGVITFLELCYYYNDVEYIASWLKKVYYKYKTEKIASSSDFVLIESELKTLYDKFDVTHFNLKIKYRINGEFHYIIVEDVVELNDKSGVNVEVIASFSINPADSYIPVALHDSKNSDNSRIARVSEDILVDYVISYYHGSGSNYDAIMEKSLPLARTIANFDIDYFSYPIFDKNNFNKVNSSYILKSDEIPMYIKTSKYLEDEGFDVAYSYEDMNNDHNMVMEINHKLYTGELVLELFYPYHYISNINFSSYEYEDKIITTEDLLFLKFYPEDDEGNRKYIYGFLVCWDECASIILDILFYNYRNYYNEFFLLSKKGFILEGIPVIRPIEADNQYILMQTSLGNGYKNIFEKLMYWFFDDQPVDSNREIWAKEHRRNVNERTCENDGNYEIIKRIPSGRALTGKKNIRVRYSSGNEYDARMRRLPDDIVFVEPVPGDTMGWFLDLKTVRDLTIIKLDEVPNIPIRHTEKNIEWLKSLPYINKYDF